MPEMRNRKKLILIAATLFIVYKFLAQDVLDVNARTLKENVLSLDQKVESVNLKDLTSFEWDTVYSFDPYTSKEQIYETVGYKWDNISEALSEGINQVVFMKDGKVVCHVFGYPENNRYGIFFRGKDITKVPMLKINDSLTFKVQRMENTTYLTNDAP
jgi:hypothetical protein